MKITRKHLLLIMLLLFALTFSACTKEEDVADKEVTVSMQDRSITGLYTGHTINDAPDGNGSLVVPEFVVTFRDKEYTGEFSGDVVNGIPEGTGSFDFDDGTNYLHYTGEFHEGAPTWTGEIEMNDFTVQLNDVEKTGIYNGSIVDGLPEGEGRYDTMNSSGNEYWYEGEWKAGKWDGNGALVFKESNLAMSRIGRFEEFVFAPDFAELVNSLGTWYGMPFTMGQKAFAFIEAHANLFPATDVSALSEFLDESVEFKHLAKSIEPYFETIIKVRGRVIETYEYALDDDMDRYTYTDLHIYDNNGSSYWCFYPGKLDYYEGDTVTVYGLPVGSSSFDNVSGGTTKVQVLAGCFTTK